MTERKFPRRSRVLILAGLLAPVVLVAVLTLLLYRSQEQLVESAQWIAHTRKAQQRLQRLSSEMVNAETAQRGFLLTSNTAYLEPYRAALATVPALLAELRDLVAGDATQRTNLRQVEVDVDAKLLFMRENVSLAESGQYQAAVASVLTGRGRDAMEKIRVALARMTNEELTLLDARQDQLARQFARHARMAAALAGLSILFAGAILYLLRRESQARAWARICAWSHTIEYEGEWLTFEEYLQRRFDYRITHGMSPQVLEEMRRKPVQGDQTTP